MDQQPACNAALPGDGQSIPGGPLSDASPAHSHALSAGAANGTGLGAWALNLLPPATVTLIILFWAFGPQSWIEQPWSIIVTGVLTTGFVLALEAFAERHEGWRLNKREFATDLFYVILSYTIIAWATGVLADGPLMALKESLDIATPWAMRLPFLVQVFLVVFLVEFGQYWMHRAMHNWTPLWLTHAPHHHITQLNAMKGYVGNPIELFLISLSVVALFDLPQAAIFCGFNILGAVSTYAHANVRSNPPLFYSFFFTTIRHHSLHHSVDYEATRCNYANSLILIDRAFGTYREGESAVVGQDDRKRLTIREQFMFPFVPVIESIKARQAKSASAVS